jgi:CBS domain-containing protein
MDHKPKNLEELLKGIHDANQSVKTTPKEMLALSSVNRRGWRVVEAVNNLLEKYELLCEPDFGSAWIYGEIEIKRKPRVHAGVKQAAEGEQYDPTPRIRLLKAANLDQISEESGEIGLVTVQRDTPITTAIHLMMTHGFSQLPILSGRNSIVGMISWRSLGRALALGKDCKTVNDCKEDATEIDENESLFSAVKMILEKEVVIVKRKNGMIAGIVTATDLGEQFIAMAEPFLLIEQIENHIRKILDEKFTIEQLKQVIDPNESVKDVKTLADLTFGAYIRIIAKPENFEKLGLNIDRVLFVKQLEEVRGIRNDVMHFDPEGIFPKEIELLRRMVSFLTTMNHVLKS